MPRRPRRITTALTSLMMVVFVAAACSSAGNPVSYDDQPDPETGLSNVETNWMIGCEVLLGQSDLATQANGICQCSYQAVSASPADGGIPFDEFVAINDELREDPRALVDAETKSATEAQLLQIIEDCIANA